MSATETDPHSIDYDEDNDNETEYAESIRPASEVQADPFQDPSASTTSLAENPFEPPDPSRSSHSLQQRESMRKSQGTRHDRSPTGRLTITRHHHSSHLHRSPSVASSVSFARTHSPSASEHGPSHPYGMFDQGFAPSRSASFATSTIHRTSSVRSTRSRQGPAHPYNLYPQDVSSLGIAPQEQIPVGFPGHAHNFRRRIGADGEERDIIGSDGHAEQLPPYSRYPDDTTDKTLAFGPMPQIGEATGSHDQLVLPAEPTEDPIEEAESPGTQEPEPIQESPSDDASTNLAMSEKASSHRSWKEKNWKEKSSTRICCGVVPLWSIMLSAIVIILLTIILGVFLGAIDQQEDTRYKNPHAEVNPAHYSALSLTPTATYYDAMPTATSNLPSLPTGTFIVPLGVPDVLYNACLGGEQLNAWTCDLTAAAQSLCVTISQQDGTDRAFLSTCNNQSMVAYGTQPPFMIQQQLKLVTDLDNTTLGPAWHFQTFYDKLVVLPVVKLQQTASKQKREAQQSWNWPLMASPTYSQTYEQYGGPVRVNDQAWFCHWDDTFIEGFIYATVSNPMPATPTSSASSITTTLSMSSTMTVAAPIVQYYEASASGYEYLEAIKPRNDGNTSKVTYSSTTSIAPSGSPSPSSTTRISTSKTPHNTSSTAIHTPTPTCIPQLVKFEERRLKGLHDSATCNLMLRMPDLTFLPVNDTFGAPVVVTLIEDDGPNVVSKKLKRSPLYTTGGGAALERRQSRYVPSEVDETCFCQWTSEQFEYR